MRDTSKRLQKTKDKIADALISLLDNDRYEDITIQEIAAACDITRRTVYRHFKTKDEILIYSFRSCVVKLADYISLDGPTDLREICLAYFRFWEENIDRLIMVRDAGVIFRFGDDFESLVYVIADRMMHRDPAKVPATPEALERYKYQFAYKTAGFWQVTELWSREDPRRSPEEMADIMVSIIESKS